MTAATPSGDQTGSEEKGGKKCLTARRPEDHGDGGQLGLEFLEFLHAISIDAFITQCSTAKRKTHKQSGQESSLHSNGSMAAARANAAQRKSLAL